MVDKRTDLDIIFASNAGVADIANPNEEEGPGAFEAGWEAEIPPYQYFNFIQRKFSEAIAHVNKEGIGRWDNVTSYEVDAIVKSPTGGQLYKAIEANSDTDPTNSPSSWEIFPPVVEIPEDMLGVTDVRINTRYFTSTTTYVKPDNVAFVEIQVQGGGGAGGGLAASGSGGDLGASIAGSAGGWAIGLFRLTATNYQVTVGAGGTGRTGNLSGFAGGTSTVVGDDLDIRGGGGLGGAGSFTGGGFNGPSGTPPLGGTSSGGQINIRGQSATQNYRIQNDSVSPSLAGASNFGSAGSPRSGTNGNFGTGFGCGGGSVYGQDSVVGINRRGGNGAPGIVIIKEYIIEGEDE